MYIVEIASEVAPIAKVGGLGDVMMGLSRELGSKGHKVDLFLPKYDFLSKWQLAFLQKPLNFKSYFGGQKYENAIWQTPFLNSIQLNLLESDHPDKFFDRDSIYGYQDDGLRFLYFCRAVLDFLSEQKKKPDIIHVHDWEAGSVPYLLKSNHFKSLFPSTKTVFTIHNLEYQGRVGEGDIEKLGESSELSSERDRFREWDGQMNLMKSGIIFSDYITTVSPTYAKEILTPEGGRGLQDTLKENSSKFCGILNGIDYSYWDPENDPFLFQRFSFNDKKLHEHKKKNKSVLLESLGMKKRDNMPLIVAVARLVPQKGIDLLRHVLKKAPELGMQTILLGTVPDPALKDEFNRLEIELRQSDDCRLIIQQEESLAHRLFAAADMCIVPSLFEPCGLTQLIAMRYGAVPIVRKTGGLADTVFDVDTGNKSNGFVFDNPTISEVDIVLNRALKMFEDEKEWHKLMLRGMKSDYSWKGPAEEYCKVYEKLLKK